MMITGKPGCSAWTCSSNSSPELPGIRMSLTNTCGPEPPLGVSTSASAASTSCGWLKLRVGSCSRASAFSSTKRIEGSSSTSQIGFMRSSRW